MYEYDAKVVRIIDADTIELNVDLGFHTWRVEKIRVMNYDAPETRLYRNVTPEEKELGLKAKAYAEELFSSCDKVIVKTYYDRQGKYGRFLADIFLYDEFGRVDYAKHMINEGYVK